MHALSELAQRVLSELEEFWEENVFAMLNTVISAAGHPQEVTMLRDALDSLVKQDHIVMGFETFYPRNRERLAKDGSLELVAKLEQWFRYDTSDPHWTLRGDMRTERYPAIYSTKKGRDKAVQILQERGYQWWRQPNQSEASLISNK